MKKIIVAASLLAASFGAYAQDYKPVAGDVTAELGLFANGIGENPISLPSNYVTLDGTQLKFRYFLADQLALRIGLNISRNSTTEKFYEGGGGSGEGFSRVNSGSTLLNAGIEKHFSGTDRLSTYAGADLSFRLTGASERWENYNGVGYVDGYNRKIKGTDDAGTNVSSFGFGSRLVAGADYYFIEKVYIGAELGWGFMATKNGKVKDTTTPGAGAAEVEVETKSTGGSFALAPLVTAGFRLGYRF